jgi:hypothetical protein
VAHPAENVHGRIGYAELRMVPIDKANKRRIQ